LVVTRHICIINIVDIGRITSFRRRRHHHESNVLRMEQV
jgi:hypothetical protein